VEKQQQWEQTRVDLSLPLAESGAAVHARQAGHWQHLTLLKGVKKGRGNMFARTSTQLDQSPSPWTLLPPGARTLVTLVSDTDGMWKMENGMRFLCDSDFFSFTKSEKHFDAVSAISTNYDKNFHNRPIFQRRSPSTS
jgi:hypothetical protein